MVTSECVGVELLMLRKSAIVRPVEKEGGEERVRWMKVSGPYGGVREAANADDGDNCVAAIKMPMTVILQRIYLTSRNIMSDNIHERNDGRTWRWGCM